jgi:hypothetical protein
MHRAFFSLTTTRRDRILADQDNPGVAAGPINNAATQPRREVVRVHTSLNA